MHSGKKRFFSQPGKWGQEWKEKGAIFKLPLFSAFAGLVYFFLLVLLDLELFDEDDLAFEVGLLFDLLEYELLPEDDLAFEDELLFDLLYELLFEDDFAFEFELLFLRITGELLFERVLCLALS